MFLVFLLLCRTSLVFSFAHHSPLNMETANMVRFTLGAVTLLVLVGVACKGLLYSRHFFVD